MTGEEIKQMSKQYSFFTWAPKQKDVDPIPMKETKGIYLYDYDGNRYVDMSSQLVCVNLGFGNERVMNAIAEQAKHLNYLAPKHTSEVRALASKKIVEAAGGSMTKCMLTLGGADANDHAVRVAKFYTGRAKVLTQYNSYHGSTVGAGSLTGDSSRVPQLQIPGTVHFFGPYVYHSGLEFESEEAAAKWYVEELHKQIIFEGPDQIACIVLESMTGSNGAVRYPNGYLEGVRELCTKYGIVMICDEVMVGFGRTGKFFTYQNYDFEPDIVTFAKGVTSSYATLGGFIVNKNISEYFDEHVFPVGLTYNAHPLGCAAAIATIDAYVEDKIFDNVQKIGKILGEQLEILKKKHPCVGDVRYLGLMSGIELTDRKDGKYIPYYDNAKTELIGKAVKMLAEKHYLVMGAKYSMILAPALTITEEELFDIIQVLDEVLGKLDCFVTK